MAVKLDMSKAYDKVEWPFLEGIMGRMGFNDGWINLIMLCVKTVTYSVLVNGEPSGMIHPTRGIRQDYSLLFCKATLEECGKVLDILKNYEDASGQKINRSKTALFFSKATEGDIKDHIKEAWGVPEIMQYEKYLGLPSFVGKGKKASFKYIKERVWRKLQGWKGKLLSQA
ncbi:uncharacterized protein LOC115980716 [Quercus lobata]|uniref:uncharacterized protein LOC115980716 n=1 Tax=Quercus lobata TaxID=97700 RepID=UPI001248B445|nr:uncharacterized protein LOC115980716 [Quercus lobata]